ncbi:MAG: amidophosphoribosyltransferase [Desulfohalobiaceae bacterium]|nr:amidophosphoribosyltransferase [Desulfohalobiaceae bacterium]
MKKENCGLVGIYNHPEAARMAYFGLYALQHRGQESAGIVTWDGSKLREQRGMGLVADVFSERHLGHELKGGNAIGHIRYSTTGASLLRNAQPFMVHFRDLRLAIGHNGNLLNTVALRRELEQEGSLFQTSMDSEIFMHLVAKNCNGVSIEEAVAKACARVQGAYSLLIQANEKIIGVRDPWGFRPLVIGRVGATTVLASETCALDLLEAEYIREVEPGEMIVLDKGKMQSRQAVPQEKRKPCIFELIYFARPDSVVFGEEVYARRKNMGRVLAEEAPVDADFCMPFPDSGVYAALGFAQESGLPFEMAMIRNHYVGRTFIQPSQDMRDFGVRVKLNPVKGMIKGKKIVIIEDSIVRGTTIRTRMKKLRELGAKELHLRVSCPPICNPCYYGIDFSSKGELIAANYSVSDIARFIGLDSLHYLSLDGLMEAVGADQGYCRACFDGEYPELPPEGCGKACLET